MRFQLRCVLAACAVTLVGAGCRSVPEARPGPRRALAEADVKGDFPIVTQALLYLPNRLVDLADVFHVSAGIGPGLGIGLKIAEPLYARLQYPEAGQARIGTFGRQAGIWGEGQRRAPVAEALHEDQPPEGGGRVKWLGVFQPPPFESATEEGRRFRDPWDVVVDVDALLAGAHLKVRLLELTDFCGGWLLVDLLEDGIGSRPWTTEEIHDALLDREPSIADAIGAFAEAIASGDASPLAPHLSPSIAAAHDATAVAGARRLLFVDRTVIPGEIYFHDVPLVWDGRILDAEVGEARDGRFGLVAAKVMFERVDRLQIYFWIELRRGADGRFRFTRLSGHEALEGPSNELEDARDPSTRPRSPNLNKMRKP